MAQLRDGSSGPPVRGRPRDPGIDAAILEATIKLLAASGVDGTSMEKVAGASGVSKVTIYARFGNKTQLIGAALAHLQIGDVPEVTGDTEDDLVALLKTMRREYVEVGGMSIIGTCLITEATSSEFLEIVRSSTLWPRRTRFAEVLQAAVNRGELSPRADVQQAVSQLIGSFYADHLAGREMGNDWDRSVVRAVLAGLRTAV